MNFKRTRRSARQASVVELAPLIDIVFLLLIFFLVSTTFAHGEIQVALPSATAPPAGGTKEAVEVTVSLAGEYTVDGHPLPDAEIQTLRTALAAHAAARSKVAVYADANATHQAVTRVLDAASRVGLRDIRLATRMETEAAPAEPTDAP